MKSRELLSVLRNPIGVFGNCSKEQLAIVEETAMVCARLFQRSSSCVEGRNAQLSLRHHGLHRLSGRKMKALTVIHNYCIKRSDGTTAAERFFGGKSQDMFECLLDRMDLPARPRKCMAKAA